MAKVFILSLVRPQHFVPLGTRIIDVCPGKLEVY